MKLNTTFWCDKKELFDKILFINTKDKSILFKANFSNKLEVLQFFKNVEKFLLSKPARDSILWKDCENWYQFGVEGSEGVALPIIWFNLEIAKDVTISYDMAFETAIVRKNNRRLSFGQFPFNIKRYPIYRELKIKARACKYIANQIRKHWTPEV